MMLGMTNMSVSRIILTTALIFNVTFNNLITAAPEDCPAGTYSYLRACIPCPTAHFCRGGRHHKERCESGTFNAMEEQSSVDACIECKAGGYCLYDGQGSRDGGFISCPPGQFSAKTKQFLPNTCKSCPTGGYCPLKDRDKPDGGFIPCRPGRFSNKRQQHEISTCQLCEPGTWSNDDNTVCVSCPKAHYCNGKAVKDQCKPGTFNSMGGGKSQDDCKPCKRGGYCPKEDRDKPRGGFIACRRGTFSNQEGQYQESICQSCEPGRWPNDNNTACVNCPKGHSCPGKEVLNKCLPGTISNDEGMTCKVCDSPGTWSNEDKTKCVECPTGYYCRGNKVLGDCPPGYAGATGAKTSTECKTCPKGTYYTTYQKGDTNEQERKCKKCAAGTYQNKEGMSGQISCKHCAAGTYQNKEGMSSCKRCPSSRPSNVEGATSVYGCKMNIIPKWLSRLCNVDDRSKRHLHQRNKNKVPSEVKDINTDKKPHHKQNRKPATERGSDIDDISHKQRRRLNRKPKPSANRKAKPDQPFDFRSIMPIQLDEAMKEFRSELMAQLTDKIGNTINMDVFEGIISSAGDLFGDGIGQSVQNFFKYFKDNPDATNILGTLVDKMITNHAGALTDHFNFQCGSSGGNSFGGARSSSGPGFDVNDMEATIDKESLPAINEIMQGLSSAIGDPNINLFGVTDDQTPQEEVSLGEEQDQPTCDKPPKCSSSPFDDDECPCDGEGEEETWAIMLQVEGGWTSSPLCDRFPLIKRFTPMMGIEAGFASGKRHPFRLKLAAYGGLDVEVLSFGEDEFNTKDKEGFGLDLVGVKIYRPGKAGDIDGWGGTDVELNFFDFRVVLSIGHYPLNCIWSPTDFIKPCRYDIYVGAITISYPIMEKSFGEIIEEAIFRVEEQEIDEDTPKNWNININLGLAFYLGLFGSDKTFGCNKKLWFCEASSLLPTPVGPTPIVEPPQEPPVVPTPPVIPAPPPVVPTPPVIPAPPPQEPPVAPPMPPVIPAPPPQEPPVVPTPPVIPAPPPQEPPVAPPTPPVIPAPPPQEPPVVPTPRSIAQIDFSNPNAQGNTYFELEGDAEIDTAPCGFSALRIDRDGPYARVPGLNISPSQMTNCTLMVGLYLESIANNRGWVLGHEQNGFDRTILMHDKRFSHAIASAVGRTWTAWNNPQLPPLHQWIHVTAVFRQGGESYVFLNGNRSDRTVIANNSGGLGDLWIGRPLHGGHWTDSWIKEVRVFDHAVSDEDVESYAEAFLASTVGECQQPTPAEPTPQQPTPAEPTPPIGEVVRENFKCPGGANRLFRTEDNNPLSRTQCYQKCYDTSGCHFFTLGVNPSQNNHRGVCMGCTATATLEDGPGFTTYKLTKSPAVPPTPRSYTSSDCDDPSLQSAPFCMRRNLITHPVQSPKYNHKRELEESTDDALDNLGGVMEVVEEVLGNGGLEFSYCFGDCEGDKSNPNKFLDGSLSLKIPDTCNGIQLEAYANQTTLGNVGYLILKENQDVADKYLEALGELANFGLKEPTLSFTATTDPSIDLLVRGSLLLPGVPPVDDDNNNMAVAIQGFLSKLQDFVSDLTLELQATLADSQIEVVFRIISAERLEVERNKVALIRPKLSLKFLKSLTDLETELAVAFDLGVEICVSNCGDQSTKELIEVFGEVELTASLPTPKVTVGGDMSMTGTWNNAFGVKVLHFEKATFGAELNLLTMLPTRLTLGGQLCVGTESTCGNRVDKYFIDVGMYLNLNVDSPDENGFLAFISSTSLEHVINIAGDAFDYKDEVVAFKRLLPRALLDSGIFPYNKPDNCSDVDTSPESNIECYAYLAIAPFQSVYFPTIDVVINQGIGFGGLLKFGDFRIAAEAEIDIFTTNPKFYLTGSMTRIDLGNFLVIGKEWDGNDVVGDASFLIDLGGAEPNNVVSIECAMSIPLLETHALLDIFINQEEFDFESGLSLFGGIWETNANVTFKMDMSYFQAKLGGLQFGILTLDKISFEKGNKVASQGNAVRFEAELSVLFLANFEMTWSMTSTSSRREMEFEVSTKIGLVSGTVKGSASIDKSTDNQITNANWSLDLYMRWDENLFLNEIRNGMRIFFQNIWNNWKRLVSGIASYFTNLWDDLSRKAREIGGKVLEELRKIRDASSLTDKAKQVGRLFFNRDAPYSIINRYNSVMRWVNNWMGFSTEPYKVKTSKTDDFFTDCYMFDYGHADCTPSIRCKNGYWKKNRPICCIPKITHRAKIDHECLKEKKKAVDDMQQSQQEMNNFRNCDEYGQGMKWAADKNADMKTLDAQINIDKQMNIDLSQYSSPDTCHKWNSSLNVKKVSNDSGGVSGERSPTETVNSDGCIDFTDQSKLEASMKALQSKISERAAEMSTEGRDSDIKSCERKMNGSSSLPSDNDDDCFKPYAIADRKNAKSNCNEAGEIDPSELFPLSEIQLHYNSSFCDDDYQPETFFEFNAEKSAVSNQCDEHNWYFDFYFIDCCGQRSDPIEFVVLIERVPLEFSTPGGHLDRTVECGTNIYPDGSSIPLPALSGGCVHASSYIDFSDAEPVFDSDRCETTIVRTYSANVFDCPSLTQSFVEQVITIVHKPPEWDGFPSDINVNQTCKRHLLANSIEPQNLIFECGNFAGFASCDLELTMSSSARADLQKSNNMMTKMKNNLQKWIGIFLRY